MDDIYDILKKKRITYKQVKHRMINTKEDIDKIKSKIDGIFVKSVFVRSNLNRYYMICYDSDKDVDIIKIANYIGLNRFVVASKEEVFTIFRLRPSALSPLSVTCDIYKKTTFLLDRDLVGKTLLVHPNMFSRTISIGYYDVIRIWDSYYARYLHMDM